jgi:rod shape-determining protein MreC
MPRSLRDIAVVLLLIGGGLLLIFSSEQDRRTGPAGSIVYTVLRPFQQAGAAVHHRLAGLWNGYFALVRVKEENKALKSEIAALRQERALLLNHERENRRLKKFLNLKSEYEFPSLVAQVIGEDASGWYRSYFINRGSDDGVKPGMAAVVGGGVVGRVVGTSASVSKVLLITDPGLSIDCRVARTRDRGVLTGYLDRECLLRYIDLKSEIGVGDEIATSGLDGFFPRGLSIGTVRQVRKDVQGLFLEAMVKPAVNFQDVEEVLVILGRQSGFDIRPGLEGKR